MFKRGLVLVLFLVVLSSLTLAETGCYTYKSSTYYCKDIEQTTAKTDCASYQSCQLATNFFTKQSCTNTTLFPECEKTYCKNDCNYNYLGKCLTGEVPKGKTAEWCNAGCCRFDYSGGNSCTYQTRKGLCELEAKNKNAVKFNFDSKINQQSCLTSCSKLKSGEKATFGLKTEYVSTSTKTTKPTTQTKTTQFNQSTINLTEEGSNTWVIFLFTIVLLAVLFYILHQRNKEEPTVEKRKIFPLIMGKSKKPKKQPKKQVKLRSKEKERGELFGIFGFGSTKKRKKTYIDLLGKTAKKHELRKGLLRKTAASVFSEIEKKVEQAKKPLTEEEKLIEELRKIASKKKHL